MARLSEVEVRALESGDPQSMAALVDRCFDEVTLFRVGPEERASLPRPVGPESPLDDSGNLRRLAMLAAWRARLAWDSGSRVDAIEGVLDLCDVGSELADDACSIVGFVSGLAVIEIAVRCAAWPVDPTDLPAPLQDRIRDAKARADGAIVGGLANALRGEFHLMFSVVVDRMPQTRDPNLALARLGSFGLEVGAVVPKEPLLEWVPEGVVLLDPDETRASYGQVLASFIAAIEETGTWTQGQFAKLWRTESQAWRSELGAVRAHAEQGEAGVYSEPERRAMAEVFERVENPLGKLLLLMLVIDVDAVAAAAQRTRTRLAEFLQPPTGEKK